MKEEDRDDKGEEGRTSQQKRARDASDAPASVTSDEDQRAKLTPVIKSQPNFVFASWLCSMLGQERLRGGSGVIDIAGGNGLLSFELTCRYGIPSTVIDPRQMKFNSILRRRMKKLTKNRLKEYNNSRMCDDDKNKVPSVKWENCVIKVQDDYHVLDLVKQAIAASDCANNSLPFQQFQVYYEGPHSPITSSTATDRDLLSNASIFVGMHPDQATEYIIDTALALRKPFAVVPCCVFAKQFPDRKTAKGETVRTYEELLTYLQQKDPGIQREFLPYLCGRNVVLYKL